MAKAKKEEKTIDEKALENRCPACKASIAFNPKAGKWKCEYCGSEFTLDEMQQHKDNASTEENNDSEKKGNRVKKDEYNKYISYKCDSCGAEIVADDQTAATFCVYCGNTAILKSKLSNEFSPDMVIPFKKTKEEAIEAFKNISKGRPLCPKDFNDPKNVEKIRGIYIPFWLYDINVSGQIVMDAKTVETWTRGDTHYTKTNTYLVKRGGTMGFDKIPADASTRFDNAIMNTIEPFNYNELVPYNHAYLSGFYAEKYDEEDQTVFVEASKRALNSSRKILIDDARMYSSKIVTSDELVSHQVDRKYAMLPVWMVNVKYKDKMHIFAMNGQTGEFIGDIPLDKKKAIGYFIMITLITFVVALICSYIAFLMGGN